MKRIGTVAFMALTVTGCANYKSFDQAFYDGMVRNSESRANNHDNQVNRDDVNAGLVNMVIHGTAVILHD